MDVDAAVLGDRLVRVLLGSYEDGAGRRRAQRAQATTLASHVLERHFRH